jgi:probable addiction module antidote protein
MTKTRSYKDHLSKQLQDHREAAEYLNAALHEKDQRSFLLALKDLAEAQGGMTQLAKHSNLNRENLYRTLSLKGNPRFFSLLAVLDASGMEISIRQKTKRRSNKKY